LKVGRLKVIRLKIAALWLILKPTPITTDSAKAMGNIVLILLKAEPSTFNLQASTF
jgi:hypothetical protein